MVTYHEARSLADRETRSNRNYSSMYLLGSISLADRETRSNRNIWVAVLRTMISLADREEILYLTGVDLCVKTYRLSQFFYVPSS